MNSYAKSVCEPTQTLALGIACSNRSERGAQVDSSLVDFLDAAGQVRAAGGGRDEQKS